MRQAVILLTCAWVLWHRGENPLGLSLWQPFSAWQTRDECARERLAAYSRRGLSSPPVGFAASHADQPTKTERLECFPDTIDPREPKR